MTSNCPASLWQVHKENQSGWLIGCLWFQASVLSGQWIICFFLGVWNAVVLIPHYTAKCTTESWARKTSDSRRTSQQQMISDSLGQESLMCCLGHWMSKEWTQTVIPIAWCKGCQRKRQKEFNCSGNQFPLLGSLSTINSLAILTDRVQSTRSSLNQIISIASEFI